MATGNFPVGFADLDSPVRCLDQNPGAPVIVAMMVYDKPLLDGLDIAAPQGSFCAVVGPSGCGKSTLTRLIAGLMFPDAGEVILHGERVCSPRRTVGMAFQNPELPDSRTILDNVILPLEFVAPRMPRGRRVARAPELLALVGLAGFEGKRPSQLSGGMRLRASLCRALVHRPAALSLDEPFGALDAFTREEMCQTMHALRAEESVTALRITHDLRESVYQGDQLVVLSGGGAVAPPGAHPVRPAGARARAAADRNARGRRCGCDAGHAAAPDRDRPGPSAGRSGCGSMTRLAVQRLAVPLAAIALFLAFREWLVWVNGWPRSKMAAPSDLWPAFWRFRRLFLERGWETLWRTVAGLGIAVVFDTLLGMILGVSRIMRDALYPLLVGFNAIPEATLLPVIALMFVARHDFNTVLVAFLISFFPIAVSVGIGLSTLEPEYRDILRPPDASRFTSFWKIALPKTLPEVFGALKVAVTLAFIGTHPMEIVSAPQPRPRGAVRFGAHQRGRSADVCGPHRARRAGHPALLRRRGAGADLCRLGRAPAALGPSLPGAPPLRCGQAETTLSGERLARAGASPTRSGPEGSSRNEPRLGRCPASHPRASCPSATMRRRRSASRSWPGRIAAQRT